MMGYEVFFYKRKTYIFRKFLVSDFLAFKENIPFCIFPKVEKEKTFFEKMRDEIQKSAEEEFVLKKSDFEIIKKSLIAVEISKNLKLKKEFSIDEKIKCVEWFNELIGRSLKFFKNMKHISETTTLIFYSLSNNFSTRPMDFLCHSRKKYNNLDAFLFDRFVLLYAQKEMQKTPTKAGVH